MRILKFVIIVIIAGVNVVDASRLKGYEVEENQPDVSYRLDEKGFQMVDEIGFTLRPTYAEEIYDIYSDVNESPYTPMFISADLPLHTLHLLVDYSVRIIEIEELLPRLKELTAGMLEKVEKDYKRQKGSVKNASEAAYIYFAVASRLLGQEPNLPKDIEKQVQRQLDLIEQHSGIDDTEFLPGVREDYSQYVPRGHYTRSEDFKRYFKAMMWFGRLPLSVPGDSEDPLLPFQMALLISIYTETDDQLATLWEEIYQPTAFFFGAAEDITPGLLYMEAGDFLGTEINVSSLSDESKLRELAAYLNENTKPLIISQEVEVYPGDQPVEVPVTVRFMPQRFVPDSYIFTGLVFDRVDIYEGSSDPKPFTWGITQMGPMRVFPRGLDAMAVVGFEKALQILENLGDTEYKGYKDQLEKMKEWYSSLPGIEKESSIYFRWFELFAAYRNAKSPEKVDADLWEKKKVMTALGSWAELRHDAILYAKQSYTGMAMAAQPGEEPEPPPPLYKAIVEEAPDLYDMTAECARVIADFPSRNEISDIFAEYAETMEKLATLSKKQSDAKSLTEDEHQWLWRVSGVFNSQVRQLEYLAVTDEADEQMALVADVHTDPNSGMVLEEATGNPARLYVLVDINGKPYIAQGATFTYYEFKHPMSDRLTDEAWQEMLRTGDAPEKPVWTDEIFMK